MPSREDGRRRQVLGRGISRVVGVGALGVVLGLVLAGQDTCEGNTSDVVMRYGTGLATDVYTIPRTAAPTVVIRTPYGKQGVQGAANTFNNQGYATVAQDLRGTGASEGTFMAFLDDGWGTTQDGYDTLAWTAAQPWSSGEMCMWGASALGIVSILAAGADAPGLRCVFALVATGDLYHHALTWGGALRNELAVNWLTDLQAYEALDAVYAHPDYSDYYAPVSIQDRYANVHAAIYSMGGWYDIFSQGNLDLFAGVSAAGPADARDNQKLLMGPWSHASGGPKVGELTYPDNAILPYGDDVRWINYWLSGDGDGIEAEAPVTYYQMGDVDVASPSWNVWRTADAWPVPATPTPFYLAADGRLTSEPPRDATSSTFVFDPSDPVPTVGGNNLYERSGPFDQRGVEARDDVLVFTSDVLAEPIAITGRVTARLWVSSSALDTDFTVKLTDVYPDGRSMLVLDGILRMRFRDGDDHEILMEPGQVYPIDVDLWSTAITFNTGHRIRVAVSSSNWPRFHVNPNNGEPLYTADDQTVVAQQVLYFGAARPSHLLLPLVPE